MNESIYLCYKRTLTSIIAASLIFEKLRNNGYAVYYIRGLRDNNFIKHIDNIVQCTDDVIVLLDEHSFIALEEGENQFLGSWFGRELITCKEQNKHIIIICLNGYNLPDKTKLPAALHFLYEDKIYNIDTFDINASDCISTYLGELKSKPILKYLHVNNVSNSNTADFLIYSDCDCSIYEFGYLVATIDSNVDKHHPFKYTVNRSGQHLFNVINNDTGQIQEISYEITLGSQKYVHIQWEPSKALASINDDEISKETDSALLYNWGKCFFFGSHKHCPNYNMALLCFIKSAELGNQKAVEFIGKYDHSLASIYNVPKDIAERWYKEAARHGSPEAWMKMGEQKEAQSDYDGAKKCYAQALKLGHIMAEEAMMQIDSMISGKIKTEKDIFLIDFHNIIENFRRQIGSGRVGKGKQEVRFNKIVTKLAKMENALNDSNNSDTMSVFLSDSNHAKYHNRMFALIGYLAQKEAFENLTHKDILEICFDENGENQSEIKEFRNHMGGDRNIKVSNIAKMADRVVTGKYKRSLDLLTRGWFLM